MKRRMLAMLLTLVMMFALVSCGSDNATGTSSEAGDSNAASVSVSSTSSGDSETPDGGTSEDGSTFKIGYNYFGSASYTLLTLANHSGDTLSVLGSEYIASDDKFSLEQLVTDVENMIAAGCDGLILWLPTDTLYVTVSEMCEQAQIPFVLNDKLPMDEEIIAQISANPYFVGAFGVKNEQYGVALANYVLEQGGMTVLLPALLWAMCLIRSG